MSIAGLEGHRGVLASERERRYKRNEDRRCERNDGSSSSGEGSSQTYQSAFEVFKQKHYDMRDHELERLHRMVRDLELEVLGRCRRRDRDKSFKGSVSVGGSHGEASRQSGSRRSRDRSRDFVNRGSTSPEWRRPQNAMLNAMSRALCKAARSPFSDEIERAQMPSRFSRLPFISYDG